MNEVLASPIFWAAVALASELGASKLKQNGVIAMIFDTIKKMKPKTDDNPK